MHVPSCTKFQCIGVCIIQLCLYYTCVILCLIYLKNQVLNYMITTHMCNSCASAIHACATKNFPPFKGSSCQSAIASSVLKPSLKMWQLPLGNYGTCSCYNQASLWWMLTTQTAHRLCYLALPLSLMLHSPHLQSGE